MLNYGKYLHLFNKPKIHTGKKCFITYYYSPILASRFGGHYQGALQEY